MNRQQKDERHGSLLSLIKSSSITVEGRKLVENWSKHLKNANYGKRTGKQVSINRDVTKLFPSSPSSSSEDSFSDITETDTNKQSEGSVHSKSSKKSEKHALVAERLSGINTKLLSLHSDDVIPSKASMLMNGTENGSFTVAASSPSLVYPTSVRLEKNKTSSIKRRLTFSEKKHLKSKDVVVNASPKISDAVEKRTKKVHPLENSKLIQKNSSVVTLAEDVTRDPTLYGEIMNEINSVSNQFTVEALKKTKIQKSKKQKAKKKSDKVINTTAKSTDNKKTKKRPLKEIQVENSETSSEHTGSNTIPVSASDSPNENVSPPKKRQSPSKYINEDPNELLESSQIQGLRNWLQTSMPENTSEPRAWVKQADNKSSSSVRGSRRHDVAYKLRAHRGRAKRHVEEVKADNTKSNDNEISEITTPKRKPVLFEVDASNITDTYEGHPNRTKTGPPMSTPSRSERRKKNTRPQYDHEVHNAQPEAEVSKSSTVISASKESIIASSSDDSLESNDNNDGYGETSPVYVSEFAADVDRPSDVVAEKSRSDDVPGEDPQLVKRVEEDDSCRENLIKQISKVSKERRKRGPPKKKQNVSANTGKQRTSRNATSSTTTNDTKRLNDSKKPSRPIFLFPEQALSPPKLIVRAPSPEAVKLGLRRSKRARVRALCSWNGEKLIYGHDGVLEGIQTADSFQRLSREADEETEWAAPKKSRKTKKENRNDNKSKERKNKVGRPKKFHPPKSQQSDQGTETNVHETEASECEQTPYVETSNPTLLPSLMEPSDVTEHSHQGESHLTGNTSSNIAIKENGKNVIVDAAQLISVPECESAFGRDGKPWANDDPVRFTKGISVSTHAMGSITIGPGQEKGLSKMKTDTLSFFVVDGTVEISIETATKILEKSSYFYVPPQNTYNIRNISKHNDAALVFHQAKNRQIH